MDGIITWGNEFWQNNDLVISYGFLGAFVFQCDLQFLNLQAAFFFGDDCFCIFAAN